MSASQFDAYWARLLAEDGTIQSAGRAIGLPTEDLFADIQAAVTRLLENASAENASDIFSPLIAFVVAPGIAITVDRASVRPSHMQCLLAAISRAAKSPCRSKGPITPQTIDPARAVTLWAPKGDDTWILASRIWDEITTASEVDQLTAVTTPSLYGNKLRIAGFVAAVVASSVQPGVPILDLMAGTGIMSRTFASRRPVWSNDANPYAALLGRCQGLDPSALDAGETIARMRDPYLNNQRALQSLLVDSLEEEARFLHGDLNEDALKRYRLFASSSVLPISSGKEPGFPARLATERYANFYFGINQCIEIDSLRAAIDAVSPDSGTVRDLCLCALVLASAACASGPHFAQPPRAHSLNSMRTIVERRARSVSWEFDLALGRLAARMPPNIPFLGASQADWREALTRFVERLGGQKGSVYVDPPYSKLQYSRYYHVLNVLLAYDYPSVEGVGRYPPRRARFSSRFEYQPSTAAREFGDLFRNCAGAGLTLILSYGDGGFVPIDVLARAMGSVYDRVEIFSEELRHHSQGRALSVARSKVTEHVLVGAFS